MLFGRDLRYFVRLWSAVSEVLTTLCNCKVLCSGQLRQLCTCNMLNSPSRDLRHFMHCYLSTENIRIGTRSVGSLLSGIMMELWGRRRAVQIAVYSLHIGWVLIAVSTVYPILLVEVAVCSFGIGASIPAIFVSKKQRNKRNMVKMWKWLTTKQEQRNSAHNILWGVKDCTANIDW